MDRTAYKLLVFAGGLLTGIGLLGVISAACLFFTSGWSLMDDTSYSFLTWSPSGDRLAFVVSRESDGHAIYVINADGKHRKRVFDDFCGGFGEGCYDGITYLRWSEDEQTLYFGNVGYPSRDWALSLTDKSFRKVSADEVPVQPNLFPIYSPTLCDEPNMRENRQINSAGILVAQTVGYDVPYSGSKEQLQICDLQSGERVFRENSAVEYMSLTKPALFFGFGIGSLGVAILVLLALLPDNRM